MYCSNCGQELNTNARFCSRCGAKIQNGTSNAHQDRKHEQTSIVCPKCKLHDKMEKVTSIVKSQTRTREQTEWVNEYYVDKNGKEQSYSYPRSYDVVEITDLAKRLYPPPKPQVKKFSGCILILGIMSLCSGLLGGALVLLNLIVLNNYPDIGIEFLGAAAGALFWLIVGILVFWAKNNQDKNEARRIAKEKPLWEDAMRIWNRLYYCHRDDIVFDGDDIKNTCQPQDVIKFCYQPKRS